MPTKPTEESDVSNPEVKVVRKLKRKMKLVPASEFRKRKEEKELKKQESKKQESASSATSSVSATSSTPQKTEPTTTIPSLQSLQETYVASMSPKEKQAYQIAQDHLQSSFTLYKSIGFQKFMKSHSYS